MVTIRKILKTIFFLNNLTKIYIFHTSRNKIEKQFWGFVIVAS